MTAKPNEKPFYPTSWWDPRNITLGHVFQTILVGSALFTFLIASDRRMTTNEQQILAIKSEQVHSHNTTLLLQRDLHDLIRTVDRMTGAEMKGK